MPFHYESSPKGSLRQGELLSGVYEHRVNTLPMKVDDNEQASIESFEHPLLITVTAWCDLLRDYEVRSSISNNAANQMDYIMTCGAYERSAIRGDFSNRGLWDRVHDNRDPRYHRIVACSTPEGDQLPELYLDFKRFLAIPISGLYEAIGLGEVRRVALIPPLYREEIIQKFYGFHSRVSLPD